jgi:AcrR family transcriptional regulator
MKINEKTLEKRNRLEDAGCKLFMEKGIANTTVDEIAKSADVAKGTFYLYFKDKNDLLSCIVLKQSIAILEQAIEVARKKNIGDFVDQIISITDYIIEYFKQNTELLTIIEKHLSWSVVNEKMALEEYSSFKTLIDNWINHPYMSSYTRAQSYHIIFMMIELVGSMCYSSIIKNQPDTIDNIKQDLFFVIRQILRK